MKQHVQETEDMRASNLLYVYARMYQMIHACRPVSVRVLRTAVREWACWIYGKCSKILITSCLLKRPRQTVQTQISEAV